MHWHFENWNDVKHEPRKFWSAKITFLLIYAKLSHTRLDTPPLIFPEGRGVCTQASKTEMLFASIIIHAPRSGEISYILKPL